MNFKASSKFTPRDIVQAQAAIIPRVVAAVTEGCAAVVAEAQILCPVESGALRDSIGSSVELVGQVVQGSVTAAQPYAVFVEYGTGVRGAGSPGAGAGPYSPTHPGAASQPFLRPAIDSSRPAIREAFKNQGFKV
jgi:hypothetical protein